MTFFTKGQKDFTNTVTFNNIVFKAITEDYHTRFYVDEEEVDYWENKYEDGVVTITVKEREGEECEGITRVYTKHIKEEKIMKLEDVAIDMSVENQTKVLQLLEENMILETGRILSPDKKVWFKHIHYIKFLPVQDVYTVKYNFKYVSKKDLKVGDKTLKSVSLRQLKHILEN